MFKFFKRKPVCKWSELPKADEIIIEMEKAQSQINQERRQFIIDKIKFAAEQGFYNCTVLLCEEDIEWLENRGYTVIEWCSNSYQISWDKRLNK